MSLFGRIEDISIVDVMQMVHLGQRSGTLFIWHDPYRAAIVFEAGRIVRIWSTEYNRLSEILKAQGLLSDRDILSVHRTQTDESAPRKFHEIMLSMGLITPKSLARAVERHIARLIREVTGWKRGSFEFTQKARLAEPIGTFAALDSVPATNLSVEYMLLEAARLSDEAAYPPPRRPQPDPRPAASAGLSPADETRAPSSPSGHLDPRPAAHAGPSPTDETRAPPSASGHLDSRPDASSGPAPKDGTRTPATLSPPSLDIFRGQTAEQLVSRLMSLYVATYQLHASLDPAEVLAAIRDVTINLVGAEHFVLLLRDELSTALNVELTEGPMAETAAFSSGYYAGGEPLLDSCLLDGILYVSQDEGSSLRAALPLKFQGEIVGALAVIKMLPHKPVFEEEDRELLNLIGMHAASALFAARLFSRTDRKLRTLESLLQLIRTEAPRA